MTTTSRITGRAALTLAEAFGTRIGKYADPTGPARAEVTLDEAREIARQDPALVYIDATEVDDREIRVLRSDACVAGDIDQIALCDLALEDHFDADDYSGISTALDRRIRTMTAREARVACVRAIADAKAQS